MPSGEPSSKEFADSFVDYHAKRWENYSQAERVLALLGIIHVVSLVPRRPGAPYVEIKEEPMLPPYGEEPGALDIYWLDDLEYMLESPEAALLPDPSKVQANKLLLDD